MNYQIIYDNICNRGKLRVRNDNVYMEKHHIIPKCIGGTDDKLNITLLTPKEHFICHLILAIKLYPNNYKLAYALALMIWQNNGKQKRYLPGSRSYQLVKEHYAKVNLEFRRNNPPKGEKNGMYGKNHTAVTRSKMGDLQRKSYENGRINHNKGIKLSEETKQKIRDKRKLQICSDETRLRMSRNRKGKHLGIESSRHKRVKCNESGLEFDCIKHIKEHYGISWWLFDKYIQQEKFSYI